MIYYFGLKKNHLSLDKRLFILYLCRRIELRVTINHSTLITIMNNYNRLWNIF